MLEMTLLVHLLQYWLHLSEITDIDTVDNDQYQLPIQLSVHHYIVRMYIYICIYIIHIHVMYMYYIIHVKDAYYVYTSCCGRGLCGYNSRAVE